MTNSTDAKSPLCVAGVYTCDTYGGKMESPTMWIGIVGFAVMSILLAKKYKAGIIVGVVRWNRQLSSAGDV